MKLPKREDKKKKFYTKKYWYINNYNSLGSKWLIDSINKIEPKIGVVIASFSANVAFYEEDAFSELKNVYRPIFYVGDLYFEDLLELRRKKKLKKKLNDRNFHYLSGQRDACNIERSMIDNREIDILIDCKGALWYATWMGQVDDEKETVRLLEKYKELLSKDGVVLIDYYDQKMIDSIKYRLLRVNKRQTKVNFFGEASTKQHLIDVFGNDFIDNACSKLLISNMHKQDLPSKMGTAAINVSQIDKMIEHLKDNSIHKKFRNAKRKKLFFECVRCLLVIGLGIYIIYLICTA